ncbi:RND family efflux transporter [Proteiniphilum saccharofermentans]|uniref:RND family efflux transporter n=1 Tax=Proteiniphilum saccharofermentans TaxID=1642647 RepID=A0A1R3TA01_9BACT|nr:efflux RND transporter periplasmic adaptor subunit [Proteiniphilum saccharofermentans]SCD20424.1 RND family efflux transporter [Proteiniphilum saccharofermentans]
MKRIKRYAVIGIIIAIAALGILQLVNNKKRLDNELQAMQQYSMVIPVEVVVPKKQSISQRITENGVLTSGAEVTILSETSGKVLSVNGNTGDKVYAGQILITVEKELAESQFQLAKTNLEHAEKDLARYDNLAGGEAVTQQQLEAIKLKYRDAQAQFTASKKQLENTTIRSPVSGIITSRSVEKGSFLLPSAPVFTIVEQDRMVFTVNMAEEDILALETEQKAEIFIDAFPENSFTAHIRGISTVPDLSGRYKVEMKLNNPGGMLRAGMNGRTVFTNETGNDGLVIPRKCIVGSVRDGKVFTVSGDTVISGQVKARTLNETEVLVTEGVTETDRIVLSGQINLEDGSKIRILNP